DYPKSVIVHSGAGCSMNTAGGQQGQFERTVVPRRTAQHFRLRLIVPVVVDPLPGVPRHIVQAELVGVKTADRRRPNEPIVVALVSHIRTRLLAREVAGPFGRRPLSSPAVDTGY